MLANSALILQNESRWTMTEIGVWLWLKLNHPCFFLIYCQSSCHQRNHRKSTAAPGCGDEIGGSDLFLAHSLADDDGAEWWFNCMKLSRPFLGRFKTSTSLVLGEFFGSPPNLKRFYLQLSRPDHWFRQLPQASGASVQSKSTRSMSQDETGSRITGAFSGCNFWQMKSNKQPSIFWQRFWYWFILSDFDFDFDIDLWFMLIYFEKAQNYQHLSSFRSTVGEMNTG